ncbi:MAG: helix-turn-helix domain-containing protein [Thermomicrobiales bacterium]
MSTTTDTEFLTVAEAASILKVDRSTVRRWIDRGDLPAVRVGQRSLRIRRNDLDRVIEPARPVTEADEIERLKAKRLTPEEQARAFAAIESARALRQELFEKYGLFSPSWEIIHEMREERDEQLWQAVTGSYDERGE